MEKLTAFLGAAWAWIQAHKTISTIAGVVVAVLVAFVIGYIKGCVK